MPAIADKKNLELDINSLKNGDKAVFAQFVNKYQDMVFACCRAVGLDPEDSEDAASETFLAVYRSIHKFDGKSKLSSWLWTIAYRKALDIRAKIRPKTSFSNEVLQTTASSQGTVMEDSLENEEQGERIWEAVQQLPESWAAAIVLFYREDKNVSEIAEILDIPANTIKTYLDRGRKKLYHSLEKYWKNDHVKL